MGFNLPLLNRRRRLGGGGFSPAALFALNEPGVWYDPSDLTTMFQDRFGTTPVTAPGQTVGLVLDKSRGLVLGPELVTNGTFDSDIAGWTNLTPAGSSFSWNAGKWMDLVFTTGLPTISTSFPTTIGKSYVATASKLGTPSVINIGSSAGGTNLFNQANSSSDLQAIFTATTTTTHLSVARISAGTSSIDNISVKELPGNHLTANSDAARGLYGIEPLGGRKNLLTFTEQFDNAAWGKTSVTVTPNFATAPDGTMTGDRVVLTGAPGTNQILNTAASALVGAGRFSVYVKADEPANIGKTVRFDNTAGGGNIVATLTDEWQRVGFPFTGTGAGSLRAISSPSEAVTGSTGYLIWGAQLELGSTATAYQKVVTALDVTEAGVPSLHYVQYDGADDGYVTPTITPGTDKAQVFAGVRKLSDTATGMVVEFSANAGANNGSFWLAAPDGAGAATYNFRSRGTTARDAQATSLAAPRTNVLAGLGDISGDRSTLRVNGVQAAQATGDQGTGNYLAYPLYIGRRGGTSLPFNGRLYSLIVRFGPNLDAARISEVERFVAGKTGVTL